MTLQELYKNIDGDYEQALKVMRMDKLVDKHIRKLTKNGVVEAMLEAGKTLDPTQMFETAHAAKGVCANLGLTRLANAASELSEEFRPGNARGMTDAEVAAKLEETEALYRQTAEGIRLYEQG